MLLPFLLTLLLLGGGTVLLSAQTGSASVNRSSGLPQEKFDPVSLALQLGAVFALILVNAFFALAEYALITVRKTRVRQLVEEGNRSAILVQRMLEPENATRMMATIQTGVTLVATLSSALAATSAVTPLAYWLQHHASVVVGGHAGTVALLLITLPVAVLSLVIGEIAPKSLAFRHSEQFALIAVHPVAWLQTVMAPAVALLTFFSNLILRPFGGKASFKAPIWNEEELKIMVEAGEEQGVLEPDETEMIHSILDFGDTVVRKVMTPRIDIAAFNVSGPFPDLIRLVTSSGHSRIPVYEGDLDNIVGIVHAKDLLALPGDGSRDIVAIRDVMRDPYFIPENKKVDELLSEFRRSRQQLALVRDEYGVTSGLVTIEDLLEQIVGDIQDEYDREEPMVHVVDANTYILDGRMGIDELNDRMDLELPDDDADTIGGFVFGLLGHQAVQGERVDYERLEFMVEATDGRRLTKVRMTRKSAGAIHHSKASETEEEGVGSRE